MLKPVLQFLKHMIVNKRNMRRVQVYRVINTEILEYVILMEYKLPKESGKGHNKCYNCYHHRMFRLAILLKVSYQSNRNKGSDDNCNGFRPYSS